MRVVAVKEQNDGVIAHLVRDGERDECVLEPVGAKLVVCPPIWGCRNRPNFDIYISKHRNRPS